MAWSKQQEASAGFSNVFQEDVFQNDVFQASSKEVSYWKPQQEINTEFNVFQADVFQNDVFQVSGVGVTWKPQQEAA